MEIKILYEEKMKNGHRNYTTIEIPDGDYSMLIEVDYQQRLAEADEDKKEEVVKFNTVQEVFDQMNKDEYNCWHKADRHKYKEFKSADEDNGKVDFLETIADSKGADSALMEDLEYNDTCSWIRNRLTKDQADAFIAVVLDEMTPEEYAAAHDLKRDTVYKRLQRAKEKLKKFF